MKKKLLYASAVLLLAAGCHRNNQNADNEITISPDAGTAYAQGNPVQVKVSYPADLKVDSVVYKLDSIRIATGKDSAAVSIKTDTLKLGSRLITAQVYAGGKPQEVSTNITLLAAKAPEEYTYQVEKTFPHDTSSFTEGLEYHNGYLYESDGGTPADGEGSSSLRKVDIATGKPLQIVPIDTSVFAEGITIIDNKLIQLTYKNKIGYVYDLNSLKRLSTFPFNVASEGWGLCNDGKHLYATIGEAGDGTNEILILNKDNFRKEGEIDVYDSSGQVTNLNEIELIDGLFYMNIWQKDIIVAVDPKTGAVVRQIDLSNLYPKAQRDRDGADVLNGIAWDAQGKRLFITGKKWPKLYQVKFSKK